MFVMNKDIPLYINEDFYTALEAWVMTKRWGYANGLGWARENKSYIEAITVLDMEQDLMEQEAMEEAKNKQK